MKILAKTRNTTFFEMSKLLQINYATMKTSKLCLLELKNERNNKKVHKSD